jgi:hypothetical protein
MAKRIEIKAQLKAALLELGATAPEMELLRERVLSTVAGRKAALNALEAQIATLEMQRQALLKELFVAQQTIDKLLFEEEVPDEPVPTEPVPTDPVVE